MLGLSLKIGGALLALALGIWLGIPGRYTQSIDEIEQVMASGGARRRKVKRRFTPLAWLQRNPSARVARDRKSEGNRPGSFRLEPPEDR